MAKAKLLTTQLKLGSRSYSIITGENAIQSLVPFLKKKKGARIHLLSDERLIECRANVMKLLSQKGFEVHEITVPAGEGLKNIESVFPIYGELLKQKANRDSILLALGGGTIGDVAGFVAATYMRGIEWVSLPTTLLAQVDSGVGGKTGINHPVGKNLIGAFHQPSLVICDTLFLKTLGNREMISGLGEIIKYGITFDPPFFKYLEKNLDSLLAQESATLQKAIHQSLRWKCKAVAKDELDRKGVREVLNFGHTFAHALETATDYAYFQHGEAVIWGMRFALALSQVKKRLAPSARNKMDSLLQKLDVPAIPSNQTPDALFDLMKKDKKAQGNTVRFVLIDRLGHSISDHKVTREHLHQAYALITQKESSNG